MKKWYWNAGGMQDSGQPDDRPFVEAAEVEEVLNELWDEYFKAVNTPARLVIECLQARLEGQPVVLKDRAREIWQQAEHFFDALEAEDNPLTAGQLIFHFQEYCREQAKGVAL